MRFDKSTSCFWALLGAAAVCACGGNVDPYAPAAPAAPHTSASVPSSPTHVNTPGGEAASEPGEGTLEVSAGAAVPSYLGAVHALVRDASGQVIGGADEDVANVSVDQLRELSLLLPAGDDYTLTLTASAGTATTTCRASLGPLSIEADSAARAQVFAWSCGDVASYVPSAVENDCDWLADWAFVTRTSAAVGDPIGVSVAGHDSAGKPAQISWSTSSSRGVFDDPAAPSTAFRCRARDQALQLSVALSDGQCRQQVTQTVACL